MGRMRIVGGSWRGRALEAPEGRATRPTTDRLRESLASMVLAAFDLDLSDVRVLDAFAGSGALGLELLSRGAACCTFVERDRRVAQVVRRNCRELGAGSRARLVVGDVFAAAARGPLPGAPFSLVVLDPPYALAAERVATLVSDLRDASSLSAGALVLYERGKDAAGLALPGLTVVKHRERGITAVTLLEMGDAHA
ncbi:16S rRNA (guanine(966)-N(2))-methyltransferase RsmD [Olsenella sp. HMSC062G07]|uniref:16S rRNA (guanine(966)-N(2))-methyltransferase RsmD n=1 Tax=Olsenella sp. HMSC062G07 TaxID=1739330 RepID=UPI001FEFA8C5|nr:16S rRNA (guanine(966)-N(2))-methyltransferase RsmD [Olsenella sp. HMSC062G07]